MPPVPTMPILSHHHHHEQHRQQQQQQQQQRHHQYNPPPQPPHLRNPSAAAPAATCLTPTALPTHALAAATSADSTASHDPPDLSGVPVLPTAAVVPGLPVMTGVPGIKIKNESGFFMHVWPWEREHNEHLWWEWLVCSMGTFCSGIGVHLLFLYNSRFFCYMVFAPVFTRLGSEQAILTQQQQAIINQQAIILVGHMFLYNKSDMPWASQK